MEMVALIVALSCVLWYLIDRGKDALWGQFPWGKYVTIAVSAIGAFAITFSFGLDLIFGLTLTPDVTLAGQILTGFTLMSGSSAVAEIIGKIKGGNE